LLFLTIPILIQTKTILELWLKIIPDYTVVFTQLVLIDILINSLSGALHILVQATGNVKKYQLIVSGLLLLNLPTSYLLLKLGFRPETTILISIIYSILALFLRLIILKNDISFPLKNYLSSVLIRVILVGILSILIPFGINLYLPYSLYNFIFIGAISSFSIVFSVFIFGINHSERDFLLTKAQELFVKRN